MAGLPDKAPFEGIIVSFAIDEVPDVLLQQLLPGGKIIYPGKDLNIYVGEKGIDNELTSEIIDTAMFKDSGSGVA
jgi:protein-L-isoaspartate O-methyltransferase